MDKLAETAQESLDEFVEAVQPLILWGRKWKYFMAREKDFPADIKYRYEKILTRLEKELPI